MNKQASSSSIPKNQEEAVTSKSKSKTLPKVGSYYYRYLIKYIRILNDDIDQGNDKSKGDASQSKWL